MARISKANVRWEKYARRKGTACAKIGRPESRVRSAMQVVWSKVWKEMWGVDCETQGMWKLGREEGSFVKEQIQKDILGPNSCDPQRSSFKFELTPKAMKSHRWFLSRRVT